MTESGAELERALRGVNREYIVSGVICFALGGVVYFATGRMASINGADPLGSAFLPRVLSLGLMVLSLVLVVAGLRNLDFEEPKAGPASVEGDAAAEGSGEGSLGVVLGFLAAMAVYVALLPVLGYLYATPPFLAVLLALAGERRAFWIATGALGLSAGLYVLFGVVLRIAVPTGVLWHP